jgi:hypothetical protein
MAEPSQTPSSTQPISRRCPDCGREFEARAVRGATANCCEACQVKRMTFVLPAAEAVPTPEMKKPWHHSRAMWLCLLIASAAVTAGVVWRERLLFQYHQWSQDMHARRAAEGLEKKDYQHAILDGRRALDFDPLDVEANRIIAKALEAQGSSEAIAWRARLNTIRPGDPENALSWARDTLKIGDAEGAEDALAVLKPADRNGATYHDLAAKVAMGKKDFAKAESHWSDAARLDPESDDCKLNLATLQVRSRSASVREAATTALEWLTGKPAHRITALRILIEDAMNHREFGRARSLADRLVAISDATFGDRLGRLSVLRGQNASDAPKYLEQLRDESLQNPEQLSVLLDWMNQNNLPLLVSDWVPALPPTLTSKPPVSLAVADAYGRGREWTKLKALVEPASWKDLDHVRLAHLAHALDGLGNVVAARTTWGRAIAECQEKPERLAFLVRLALAWRWDEPAELTLRKLAADERTPLWVLDALWSIARKSNDSAELHRLSRLIVKARPKNPAARNNFIRLSLLRHLDEGATAELAATLFKENPADIACAGTYALSLFLKDKVYEAVETMQAFPADKLRAPEAALYYGIFLQASGESAKADEFFALSKGPALLREEEELVAKVGRDSRFNTLTPTPKTPKPDAK